MMISLQSYVHRGKTHIKELLLDPTIHIYLRVAGYLFSGFGLSAASLFHIPIPLAMGLVFSCSGWSAVLTALGGILGYLAFWGAAGQQGVLWCVCALPVVLLLPNRRIAQETPIFLPSVAGLIVSAAGVVFQTWLGDTTPIWGYLIRVGLGAASAWVFYRVLCGRNPVLEWIAYGFGVLALAQISLTPYFSFGVVAAGALAVVGAFPTAALAGLALDLAGLTPISMTAVMCGAYLWRFLPKYPRWMGAMAPAMVYLLIAGVGLTLDFTLLPALMLGGIIGVFLPSPTKLAHRRGETGMAQVRLEMVSGVLAQTEQLLLEVPEIPVDEDALVTRAAEQACAGCPCRRNCKDSVRIAQLSGVLLHKPLLSGDELPIVCRKNGRFLAQLHRAQEQLRSIRADRERQKEYRTSVIQQYRFLSEYLQDLADGLSRKAEGIQACFTPQVQMFGNRPSPDNGDRCVMFAGPQCRYYVILCDGMGTGLGAVHEGKTAAEMLRRLLTAGYPVEYALQSVNSLCALRGRAGAVTVDLLEIQLETGKAMLCKWGAAPSYLISGLGAEKIGTAGPPPGMSVTDGRELSYRLSLRKGGTLVMVSDGIGEEEALRCCLKLAGEEPEAIARSLLACGLLTGEDDATVVTVRLDAKG